MTENEDSFKKGKAFEDFVENNIFTKEHYTIHHKTHGFEQNSKRFVEDSKYPDFTFRVLKNNQLFNVEAKYRSGFNSFDKIEVFSNPNQYIFFKEIDSSEKPIFILLGCGDTASNPDELSLIPFAEIKYTSIYRSLFKKYKIDKKFIANDDIIKLLPTNIENNPKFILNEPTVVYNTQKPPTQNRFKKPLIFGSILTVTLLGLFFYFNVNKGSEVSPKTIKKLKERVSGYYNAITKGNVDLLDYYVNDHLDTWYDAKNVNLSYVKESSTKYFRSHPVRSAEIKWETFNVERLPNGDYSVNYEMTYRVKKRNEKMYKKYNLIILSIWNKNYKLNSLHEEILNE